MIPPSIKKKALDKLSKGATVQEVAANLELSRRTVYSWRLQKPRKVSRRPLGRPRKIPPRRVQWARDTVQSKKLSANDIKKKLYKNSKGDINVSTRTVQRCLKRGNDPLKYKKVVKKPFLTDRH